ncbi:MAG: 5-(carboxyamino)imidazole ribonucleotide synthase [Rikenellaceae bacterium]
MTKRIGIVGGGQLGLMIAQAAGDMGIKCVALDPAADAPAFAVCEDNIVAPYDDVEALVKLCEMTDVVTYEFENIPAEVVELLCSKYNIKQGCAPLLDSQDRLREKLGAKISGLRTPKFAAVNNEGMLKVAIGMIGLPAVLKSRRMGYDGKGQVVIKSLDDIEEALDLLSVPCILEEFVDFDFEVSTVVVRADDGYTLFPIGRNIHRRGVLDLCIVPAEISHELHKIIERQTIEFMEKRGYYGILAIEYFVKGNKVIFNEMAPRPHNSGHYTIEGSSSSQFSELVRFLIDEPLQGAVLNAESVIMKNILGEDYEEAQKVAQESHEGVYVHDYGKSECKKGRKMAHITYVGLSEAEYRKEWASRFVE